MFQQTSRELRTLPNRLMREANEELGDAGKELKDATNIIGSKPYNSITPSRPQPSPVTIPTPENKIVPPATADNKANESDSNIDA
jgi:hypothetical protein